MRLVLHPPMSSDWLAALRAAAPGVPGTSNGASTTAVDIALAVNTALESAPGDELFEEGD